MGNSPVEVSGALQCRGAVEEVQVLTGGGIGAKEGDFISKRAHVT